MYVIQYMSRHMSERTTVRLPEELLTRAKRKAAKDGTTLTALIEQGLRAVVAEKSGKIRRRSVDLPVSKASGGLLPGFVWERIDMQAQDNEDLAYLERPGRTT